MKLLKKVLRSLYGSIFTLDRRWAIRYSDFFRAFHLLVEVDQRERIFERAMRWAVWLQKSGLTGDYLEFGVFEGYSFATSFYWAKKYHLDSMRFYAFDSFQGLPPTQSEIDAGFEFPPSSCICDLETFRKKIVKKGVDLDRVTIVPGFYNEVLNEETKKNLEIKQAVVVFIDCDTYDSTVPVLDFLTDYLVDGSLLIFTGWFNYRGIPTRGQQRATREWLAKNPGIKLTEYCKFPWAGNSFIVYRE